MQTGRHLVEECTLLTEARRLVEKEEMREWETRHSRDKKKKKGDVPVGTEKEKEEEEGERLANFFYTLHEFFAPTDIPANVFPATLPARYLINPVPASDVRVSAPVVPTVVTTPVNSTSTFAVPTPRVFFYPACYRFIS